MKKPINLLAQTVCALLFYCGVQAQQTGIFQTYAVIDVNGTGNQFFAGGLNADGGTPFDGQDFGNVTTLVLNGGEAKTFKNGGGDVFGAEISYNIHEASSSSGSFTTINLPFSADLGGGDQRWQETSSGVDLLAGLPLGTYHLEVFWRSPTSLGDRFDSNGGANFTATFTINQPGFYNNTGVITQCPAGSFCIGDGSIAQCPAGSFSSDPGQFECVSCGPGTCQDQPGQTSCFACSQADLVLTASESNLTQCETFTVLVSVNTDDSYNTVEARLNFDPNELEVISVAAPDGSNVLTNNPPFDTPAGPVLLDNVNGEVAYAASSINTVTGDEDFILITFEVEGTSGTTSISPITGGFPRSRIAVTTFTGGIPTPEDILANALPIDLTLNPDIEDPTITCLTDATRTTDLGVCTYTVQGTELDPINTSDNCGVGSVTNNINGGSSLAGEALSDGTEIIWTVVDDNGNDATCSFFITVNDEEDPVITCTSDFTLYLDDSGNASIQSDGTIELANSVNDFSGIQGEKGWTYGTYNAFNAAGFSQLTYNAGNTRYEGGASFGTPFITPENAHPNFDNNDWAVRRWTSNYTGTVSMDLEFQDLPGFGGDGTHVRVLQNGAQIFEFLNVPQALTTWNLSASVTYGDEIDFVVDAKFDGSDDNTRFTAVISATGATATDNCDTPAITASNINFDCSNIGTNTVTFTATDLSGNSASCNATVTIVDDTAPATPVLTNITEECSATLTVPTTTDNCAGTVAGSTSDPLTYTTQGTFTVTWNFDDGNGNDIDVVQTVIVDDVTAPVPDAGSLADVTAECSVASITAPTATDNCEGTITGTTTTTFPITAQGTTVVTWNFDDGNGNSSMQTQNVVIDDVTDPVAPTLADITGECSATVPVPTTTDNCAGTVTGSTSDPLTYTTQGTFTVTWNFDDGNGNDIDVVQTVIVDDVTAPIVSCPENITVSNDAGQCGAIVTFNATATDNCGGTPTITYSQNPGTFFPVGITTVNVTADDGNGNMANCSFTVTVEDNESPNAVCQNVTVTLDSSGNSTITPLDIGSGSTDNCGIASISLDETMFDCSDVGANTVTLTVTDVNGNSSTCSATVTVEDNVAPTAICQDLTVQLDASGAATITAAQIDNGSSDNCGIASISLDETMFDCADVGANTVTLTVTDASGNSSMCTTTVTVEDNTNPTAVCQDITVSLDGTGSAIITANDVDGGSSDACGIATLEIDVNSFTCADLGSNDVVLTVTDNSGNTSTCTASVTVEDNEAPVLTCVADPTVTINQSNNTYLVSGTEFDPSVADNCFAFLFVSHNAGDFVSQPSGTSNTSLAGWEFPIGTTTVTFSVVDAGDNEDMCTVTITVLPTQIAGNVLLNGACLPLDMTVSVYQTGSQTSTGVLVATFSGVQLDANGDFSFDATGVVPGNYDLYFKPENYLTKLSDNQTVSTSATGVALTNMVPGDIDNSEDNQIDGDDVSPILTAYNTEDGVDAGYNADADLNCDGFVDALDLSLIIFFFLTEGDAPMN